MYLSVKPNIDELSYLSDIEKDLLRATERMYKITDILSCLHQHPDESIDSFQERVTEMKTYLQSLMNYIMT